MSDTHHFTGISGVTCLAKEDPDTDASFATRGAAGTGSLLYVHPCVMVRSNSVSSL